MIWVAIRQLRSATLKLTCAGINFRIVVDVGIAQRAASDSVTADSDGSNWSNLQYRTSQSETAINARSAA